jgi:hypothetical protein
VLTDKMVEAIKYFINTSEEDLEYIFGESFTFSFISYESSFTKFISNE